MNTRFRLFTLPALVLLSLLSLPVMSEGYKTDMEESLKLSESQKTQIDEIEQKFRKALGEMKKAGASREEMTTKMKKSLNEMRKEVSSVLTDEQKSIARQQIQEQKLKRMKRQMQKLARQLALTEEQKTRLRQEFRKVKASWPMDKDQLDNERREFNNSMKSVLNDEQLKKWQDLKNQSIQKWRHHSEEKLKQEGN